MVIILLHMALYLKGKGAVVVPSLLFLVLILVIRYYYHKNRIQDKIEDTDDEDDDEDDDDNEENDDDDDDSDDSDKKHEETLPFEEDEAIDKLVNDIADDTDTNKHLKMLNISKNSSRVNNININEYEFQIDDNDMSEEKHNEFLEILEKKNRLVESVDLQRSAQDSNLRTHKGMRQMFKAALNDADAGYSHRFKDKIRVIRNQPRKFDKISILNTKVNGDKMTNGNDEIVQKTEYNDTLTESNFDVNAQISDVDIENIDNSYWSELLKEN